MNKTLQICGTLLSHDMACRLVFGLALGVLPLSHQSLLAQSGGSGQPAPLATAGPSGNPKAQVAKNTPLAFSWERAENRWQSEPVDLSSQTDPTAPELRARRTAHWTRILADRIDMERRGLHALMADGSPMRMDLVRDPKATWVIAKFESYTVLPVDPDCLVMYTEMHFRIERVLQQPKGLSVKQAERIDVERMGGSAKAPSGEANYFEVRPLYKFVQPGNTYILELGYNNESAAYGFARYWTVENGKVTGAYTQGSPYIGLSVEDFVSRLRAVNSPN